MVVVEVVLWLVGKEERLAMEIWDLGIIGLKKEDDLDKHRRKGIADRKKKVQELGSGYL